MKHLIYILCFFVFVLVQVIIKNTGIILGGLPTALLCGLTYWCAARLCKTWDKHKEKKAGEAISRQAAQTTLAGLFAEIATEQAEFIKANKTAHTLNLNDPEYGLVPEKPVYCCYVDGSKDYLNSLRTESGEKLEWNRRGSMYVDGINGMVDIYDSTLPNGQAYKTVYINMYASSTSTSEPAGFALYQQKKNIAVPTPAPSKPKARFCKLCGDPIDPVTRKCTGCRKQYFRLPVFTDKHYFIAATAVACVVVILLLVALVSQRSSYEARIAELNTRVSELEDEAAVLERANESFSLSVSNLRKKNTEMENRINSLTEENRDMKSEINFYDNYVVFVCNNGTDVYHHYDCEDFGESRFWAYNISAAEDKGYDPCPKCFD